MKTSVCLIASAFIGASLYTSLKCDDCEPNKSYKNSLEPVQLDIYKRIIDERRRIYIKGLVIGTVLAVLYLWYTYRSANMIQNSCIFATIVFVIQYFYYIFSKKEKYMLNYLINKEQISGWLNVYKNMKNRYHIGMVLGLLGYVLIAYGIKIN